MKKWIGLVASLLALSGCANVEDAGFAESGIVDGTSTRVINETQVKILAFYDNEWGYANRMIDITEMIGGKLLSEV